MQVPSIFTNKEWVVPPRPKPGRKPAADTPPTKRKAQNRAAQRAFRERRAARVGELEEQMQQMEEEDEKEREELQARIQRLEADLDRFSRSIVSWSAKCQSLEDELSNERRLRTEAEERMKMYGNIKFRADDVVPLRPRTARQEPISDPGINQTGTEAAAGQKEEDFGGCGNCSLGTRCECIERAFDISDIASGATGPPSKRPHSPISMVGSKKARPSSAVEVEPEEGREIDFTEKFSTKRSAALASASNSVLTTIAAPDPCGFCQDGTPCICAQMAAEERRSYNDHRPSAMQSTPKPSEPLENPCINGPGTCQQCRSDANSKLFCESLAASRKNTKAQFSVVQAAATVTPVTVSSSQESSTQAITGKPLSCADAYTTISRHPAYERASQDPGAWLPKLATIPGGVERTAFEVEAASVMQTLRFFDRRFGQDA